jgi:hypothetical protein
MLDTATGKCPLCGELASKVNSQGHTRTIKSKAVKRKPKAPNLDSYYHGLQPPFSDYYRIAKLFERKVWLEDREDLIQDIILDLTLVQSRLTETLTEPMLYRIASRKVADYWFSYYKRTAGLDCKHCSKAQRRKCKEDDLYRECAKAIKLESLNKPVLDTEGNLTELGDILADDKALDVGAWLDSQLFLKRFPARLVEIAERIYNGEALKGRDREYLSQFRRKTQLSLTI